MLARSLFIAGFALFTAHSHAQTVTLGPAPTVPADPPAGSPRQAFDGGTWIDTSNRAAVIDAFNNTWLATNSVDMGWNGDIQSCTPGDVAPAWKDAVARRINWYRGMAGVPMWVTLNSLYTIKNQKAALMMSANQTLSHNPPTSWGCYSSDGAEAAGKSNICALSGYGNTDPGCVASYVDDKGVNNQAVGHRRWLLYPQTTLMGTGDVFQSSAFPRANAIWVVDLNTYSNPRPTTRDEFVAWPPRGYTPYQVVPARWSFSYAGADFTNASVQMVRDGVNIGLSILPLASGTGEPTIVWEPADSFGQPGTDVNYTITINNMTLNGSSRSFTYTVTMIDPARTTVPVVPVTIQTSPSGLSVTVDSATFTAPVTFNWSAGSQHSIGAVSTISFGATRYLYTGWNQGGGQVQTVVVPSTGVVYTANYVRQHRLTTVVSPSGSAGSISLSPSTSDGFYYEGAAVGMTGVPAGGWTFSSWTGDIGSSANPVTISMSGPRSVTANFTTPCSYSLGAVASNYPSVGGSASMNVNTQAGCTWTARSLAGWITITSTPTQTGAASFSYTVQANTSATPRSGIIQVEGASLTVNQAAATNALQFVPLYPCRLVDTRQGGGKSGIYGPPSLNGYRDVPLPSSGCGVPSNAVAYSLNLTAVPPAPLSYVSIWPADQPQPAVSTLNSWDGRVVANAAIVSAGAGGVVRLFSSSTTDLILDINGYFVPAGTPAGLMFYPLPPCRAFDTRNGSGKSGNFGPPSMVPGAPRTFSLPASGCPVPSNAQAFSLNLTAVPSGPLAYVTVWPGGQSQPNVSTLNAFDGSVVANAAIVPAGADGTVSVQASNPSDLIVDINGYFAAPSGAGYNFFPVTPCRAVDTRQGAGKSGQYGPPTMAAGSVRSFDLANSGCNIPASARANSLNFTVVPPAPLAYLTSWATGQPQPVASTLNAWRGQVTANGALVPAGANSSISVYVSNTTDLIVDVNGYFGQ